MTIDDLEAVVRRELSAVARAAQRTIPTAAMNQAADAILAAAGDYAVRHAVRLAAEKLREPESVTGPRRAELENAVARRNRTGARP